MSCQKRVEKIGYPPKIHVLIAIPIIGQAGQMAAIGLMSVARGPVVRGLGHDIHGRDDPFERQVRLAVQLQDDIGVLGLEQA